MLFFIAPSCLKQAGSVLVKVSTPVEKNKRIGIPPKEKRFNI